MGRARCHLNVTREDARGNSPTVYCHRTVTTLSRRRAPVDVGSTAFILAATMAVALMIPGLALFYGGMVSSRSILNMIMMVFGAVAVVGVLWTFFGYSAVFGDSVGGAGLIGDVTEYLGLGQLVAGDE